MPQLKKNKDDAYFKAVQRIALLLVSDQADDAAHSEADSEIGALARAYGLSYTAVLKDVLARVKFNLTPAKPVAKKLKP